MSVLEMCRFHGGNPPRGILYDFSTPINPLGAPKILKDLIYEAVKSCVYEKYPDYMYKDLKEAIAEFYNVDPQNIVVSNGAAEALTNIILCLRPKKLIVFEPTFGDYKCLVQYLNIPLISIAYVETVDSYRIELEDIEYLSRYINERNSVVLFSNPNNPTGAYIDLKSVEEIAKLFNEATIVVDEAFTELCRECVSAQRLTKDYENIVVVKSLTKTFGVPGLRIGFVYTSNRGVVEALEICRQPWNVNSIASYIFTKAFKEFKDEMKRFIEESQKVVETEREFLSNSLKEMGLKVYKSHAPYILVKHSVYRAEDVIKALNSFGIHVRDASKYPYLTPYHIRVAVRLRKENEYLVKVYREAGIR